MLPRFSRLLASLLSGILLVACGGGSATTSPPTGNTPPVSNPPVTTPAPTPVTVSSNKLGAWLWYIDEIGKTHDQVADELAVMGVKRVFIKIADGKQACSLFKDACDTRTLAAYKSRGIEPWAWSYNYPTDAAKGATYDAEQADALYQAAKVGYVGYISDLEVEFDRKSVELESLLKAFRAAQAKASQEKWIASDFPFGVTTWGNPKDHGFRIDIVDQYVDFHMPQTYVEVWGSSYMNAIPKWIEAGSCEYRELGAKKPIWHIVSTEYDEISPAQLNEFIQHAGPNSSIWRIPGKSTVNRAQQTLAASLIEADWKQVDWARTSYLQTPCNQGAYSVSRVAARPVAYFNQNENAYEPTNTCNLTSLAMVLDTWGISNSQKVGKRLPDWLYEQYGKTGDPDAMAAIFNDLASKQGAAVRDTVKRNGTLAELRARASVGDPTIVHGWFTAPGHILVVTGYDGERYTVNDPYGKWSLQKYGSYDRAASGQGIQYPKAAFEAVLTDNGKGDDLWLHTFQ
ncbi:C39 family peptidase [Chitinimonas sp. BJYL2]|uniref:C39 family peptidase n=1 Tax=Chitinimonas sp. BJYL2 TaxID=2976696 RepID=UPI0022B53B09|nr:C39 family peptidase [Chitinimonas sp. BJYL2]